MSASPDLAPAQIKNDLELIEQPRASLGCSAQPQRRVKLISFEMNRGGDAVLGARPSAVVPNVQVLVGRREILRRGPGLQGYPGARELGLGRVEISGRAHGESAGEVDDDVPEPDARLALASEANPADALPVLEDGIIMRADRTQLQHLQSWETTTPHQPNILAGRRWFTHWTKRASAHGSELTPEPWGQRPVSEQGVKATADSRS
jgi:hypothetical protein